MTTLVERFGATAVSAVASLVFLLPLAAWAGAVDLYPSPAVWLTGAIGLILIVPWALFARAAYRRQRALPPTPHRFDWSQMGSAERGWALGGLAAAIGVAGWLNAAATVDLKGLGPGLAAGHAGPWALVAISCAVLLAMLALAWYCWRRNGRAFRTRRT